MKSQERELLDSIDNEAKMLRGVEGEIQRVLIDIDRLKDSCSHFLIFEYLLREFLRVS